MELSKRDKKVAREVIEKGLEIEFSNALKEAEKVIANCERKPLGKSRNLPFIIQNNS